MRDKSQKNHGPHAIGFVAGTRATVRLIGLVLMFSAIGLPHLASATTIPVDNKSNIYQSGLVSPGGNLGLTPPSTAVTGGTSYNLSATGSVQFGPGPNSPDGVSLSGLGVNPTHNSLAGPTVANGGPAGQRQARFLAAVFLDNNAPSGSPGTFSQSITDASFSPGLGQIFFVGDGLTGTGIGVAQTIVAPAGATRLFFGFIDSCSLDPLSQDCYQDNSGALNVELTAVPLPAAAWLFISALGGLAAIGRRRRMTKPTA